MGRACPDRHREPPVNMVDPDGGRAIGGELEALDPWGIESNYNNSLGSLIARIATQVLTPLGGHGWYRSGRGSGGNYENSVSDTINTAWSNTPANSNMIWINAGTSLIGYELIAQDGSSIQIRNKDGSISTYYYSAKERKRTLKDAAGNVIEKPKGFATKTLKYLNQIASTEIGNFIITMLSSGPSILIIQTQKESKYIPSSPEDAYSHHLLTHRSEFEVDDNSVFLKPVIRLSVTGSGGEIFINFKQGVNEQGKFIARPDASLFHELINAFNGSYSIATPPGVFENGIRREEWVATYFENIYRNQSGYGRRETYGGVSLYDDKGKWAQPLYWYSWGDTFINLGQ